MEKILGQCVQTQAVRLITIATFRRQAALPFHDRMPVILSPDDYGLWLDPEFGDKDKLQSMLKPYERDDLEAYPVSTLVNSPTNDVEECVTQLT